MTRPRIPCPRCGRVVAVTRFGLARQHPCPHGAPCETVWAGARRGDVLVCWKGCRDRVKPAAE
jgi:hypothetical protein